MAATDVALTKAQARRLAQVSHDGLARAVEPAHTMGVGDAMFALAAGRSGLPGNVMALSMLAARMTASAVLRKVFNTEGRRPRLACKPGHRKTRLKTFLS